MPTSILDARRIAVDAVGFDPAEMGAKLQRVADLAILRWKQLAAESLSDSTARRYNRAIQYIEQSPTRVAIALVEDFANMIEQGQPAWDMRVILQTSPKARTSKRGFKYMPILFRHAKTNSLGNAGTPIGQQFGDEGAAIQKRVLGAAKSLRNTLTGADAEAEIARVALKDPEAAKRHLARMQATKNKTLWGGIPELDTKPNMRGRLQAGLAPKLKAWHTTDLYAGMVRFGKTYAKGSQDWLGTFRMLSNNPDTMRDAKGGQVYGPGKMRGKRRKKTMWKRHGIANWIHPGLRALNLVDRVVAYLEAEVMPAEFGDR